jgi:hypothetical protein
MKTTANIRKIIVKKINQVPPEKINEILDFIEFITFKNSHHLMLEAQQKTISKYWDDPKLDIYND